MMTTQTGAQRSFDEKYITGPEIMRELNLTRHALHYARHTGKLPHSIVLNEGRLFIWERSQIQPYLDAWKIVLDARRGV